MIYNCLYIIFVCQFMISIIYRVLSDTARSARKTAAQGKRFWVLKNYEVNIEKLGTCHRVHSHRSPASPLQMQPTCGKGMERGMGEGMGEGMATGNGYGYSYGFGNENGEMSRVPHAAYTRVS